MVKPVIDGNANYILQKIKDDVEYGEHNLLIYPNLKVLTEIYSRYFKTRLDANKEIILFLSTYQNVNCIRHNLRDVDVDVAKCEDDGSLVIMDAVRGYFGSEVDVLCLVKILSRRAQNQSRSGCFVIADMGSFYMIRMVNELMKYEASMPLKFGTSFFYCSYQHARAHYQLKHKTCIFGIFFESNQYLDLRLLGKNPVQPKIRFLSFEEQLKNVVVSNG